MGFSLTPRSMIWDDLKLLKVKFSWNFATFFNVAKENLVNHILATMFDVIDKQ